MSLVLARAPGGDEVRRVVTEYLEFTAARFSPDGSVLAVGTRGGTVRRWLTASGKELPELRAHKGAVLTLAFAPDGRTLATSSREDQAVRLFDAATGKERGRLIGHNDAVYTLTFAPDGRTLVTGGADAVALVWDLGRQASGGGSLESLWADLADADGAKAYRAIWALAGRPAESLPMLKERLRPVPPAPPARVASLLADLDSRQFAARQKATAGLEQLAGEAEPYLQQALRRDLTLEARRRVEQLLEKLYQRGPTPEELRPLRAVEALERMGTPAAREVLTALAGGAEGASQTEHARAALLRLKGS